jgi:hypothetical protein
MSSEVAVRSEESQEIQLSDGKARQLYIESQKMYHHGQLYGWQEKLFKAASLWNIRTFQLYKLDGLTFEGYCGKIGIGHTFARQLVTIGDYMMKSMEKNAKGGLVPATITQKSIKDTFEPFFANGHVVTLKSLYKATTSLAEFESALNGETPLPETNALKLLQRANTPSERQLERDLRTSKGEESDHETHDIAHARLAEAKGYVWNAEHQEFTTEEGYDLTPEQEAELITDGAAIAVWQNIEKEISSSITKVLCEIRLKGDTFATHALGATHKHRTVVDRHFKSIRVMQEVLSDMISSLHACEVAEAISIGKGKPLA